MDVLLSVEAGGAAETLQGRGGEKDRWCRLSVCLSQPLSTGRCSMLSPTIILPLIQLLALLHWPPIGSRFGGMHRLHLPAARISAFLNKAPPLAPPLPSLHPSFHPSLLHDADLAAPHYLLLLFGRQTHGPAGVRAPYLIWQHHHTGALDRPLAERVGGAAGRVEVTGRRRRSLDLETEVISPACGNKNQTLQY